jgi:hypothetical protein
VPGDLRGAADSLGLDQGVGHGTVGAPTLHGRQVGGDHLAEQGVGQPVVAVAPLDDEPPGDEALQRLTHVVAAQGRSEAVGEDCPVEAVAGHGESAEDRRRRSVEAFQAGPEQGADAVRHAGRRVVWTVRDELLDEERVAGAARHDVSHEPFRVGTSPADDLGTRPSSSRSSAGWTRSRAAAHRCSSGGRDS